MKSNLLFYSNNCEASQHLLSMMQQENLIRFFTLLCTDNNISIPSQITVTPTLIIAGVPSPYVGGDAFSWLSRIKQWKMQVIRQNMNNSQQEYLKKVNENLANDSDSDKLLPFCPIEMNKMSDMFSFFSQNINSECQESLPQTYFSCDNIGKDNICTPPLENGTYKANKKLSVNKDRQDILLSQLQTERKQQEINFKTNIDKFRKMKNK